LYNINNEAKIRRLTRSLVVGKAKVMEWEDMERVRAERAAKGQTAAEKGRGKRGSKHKVSTREADGEVEGEAGAQDAGPLVSNLTVKKTAKRNRVERLQPLPVPWRASVAQMY
jgi:hypothetical protein